MAADVGEDDFSACVRVIASGITAQVRPASVPRVGPGYAVNTQELEATSSATTAEAPRSPPRTRSSPAGKDMPEPGLDIVLLKVAPGVVEHERTRAAGEPDLVLGPALGEVQLTADDVVTDRQGRALEIDISPLQAEHLPTRQAAVEPEEDQGEAFGAEILGGSPTARRWTCRRPETGALARFRTVSPRGLRTMISTSKAELEPFHGRIPIMAPLQDRSRHPSP